MRPKQKHRENCCHSLKGRLCFLFFFFFFSFSPLFLISCGCPHVSCIYFIHLFLHLGFFDCFSPLYPKMITRVLLRCDSLGCIIFASTGNANVVFTSQSIIPEKGDLFGSAYIVELGHYPIHWAEYGWLFLDQISIPI